MSKNIYILDGKEFTSIRSLSQHSKVNEKTITARLRRGWSVEEACRPGDRRSSWDVTLNQVCRDQKKNSDLVRNRLSRGYNLHDALNKPKSITKQGKSVVVDGVLYNSIMDAIRAYGMEKRENAIRAKMARGVPILKALESYGGKRR